MEKLKVYPRANQAGKGNREGYVNRVAKSDRMGTVEPGRVSKVEPGRKQKATPSYGRGAPATKPNKVNRKVEPSKAVAKQTGQKDSFQKASRENRSDSFNQKKIGLRGHRGK